MGSRCIGYPSEYQKSLKDESHIIKNYKTIKAKKCFELKSKHKLCLTGTPLQNSLDELYSLFKFLRHPIYSRFEFVNFLICIHNRTFRDLIIRGRSEDVIPILKKDFISFTMRRTKIVLDTLPPRIIKLVQLEFKNEIEERRYAQLRENSRNILQKVLNFITY